MKRWVTCKDAAGGKKQHVGQNSRTWAEHKLKVELKVDLDFRSRCSFKQDVKTRYWCRHKCRWWWKHLFTSALIVAHFPKSVWSLNPTRQLLSAFRNIFPQINTRVFQICVFYYSRSSDWSWKQTLTWSINQMKPRLMSAGRPPVGRPLRKSFRGRGGPMGSKRGRGRRPRGRSGLWSYSPPMIPGSGGWRGTGTGLKMSRGCR